MHVRYQRAAVAADEAPRRSSPTESRQMPETKTGSKVTQVLWASPALTVRAGRLTGIRLREGVIEVGLVRTGADHLRWVPAESVLTEYQAALWLRSSRFLP